MDKRFLKISDGQIGAETNPGQTGSKNNLGQKAYGKINAGETDYDKTWKYKF